MGESGGLSSQNTLSPLEYLDQLCDYALSIGMTYDQYWYDNPYILLHYVRADGLRAKRENNRLWLQGYYVYVAVGSLVPLLNPFSKDKKPKPYLKEPIPTSEKELEERRLQRLEKWTSMMMSKVKK